MPDPSQKSQRQSDLSLRDWATCLAWVLVLMIVDTVTHALMPPWSSMSVNQQFVSVLPLTLAMVAFIVVDTRAAHREGRASGGVRPTVVVLGYFAVQFVWGVLSDVPPYSARRQIKRYDVSQCIGVCIERTLGRVGIPHRHGNTNRHDLLAVGPTSGARLLHRA